MGQYNNVEFDFKDVYSYALKQLVKKNYFTGELKAILEKKFPGYDMESVMQTLKKDRYLNDERFFKDFVRWRAESLYGPYYIREKLRHKGYEADFADILAVMQELEMDLDEIILKAVDKYKRTKSSKKKDFFRACFSWLSGRGFPQSNSIKILKREVEDESNFFEGR